MEGAEGMLCLHMTAPLSGTHSYATLHATRTEGILPQKNEAFQYKVVRSVVDRSFSIHQLLQFYDHYHAEIRFQKEPPRNECALVNLYDWAPRSID